MGFFNRCRGNTYIDLRIDDAIVTDNTYYQAEHYYPHISHGDTCRVVIRFSGWPSVVIGDVDSQA